LRQIRGNMLKYMVKNGSLPLQKMSFITSDAEKGAQAIESLVKDGLVRKSGKGYRFID
jgi:hypothetical protein